MSHLFVLSHQYHSVLNSHQMQDQEKNSELDIADLAYIFKLIVSKLAEIINAIKAVIIYLERK